MTTAQLKEILLHEHKREVRLTYIQYTIVAVVALLLLGLIAFLFISTGASMTGAVNSLVNDTVDSVNSSGKYAIYYKLIIPIALICTLGYPVYEIVKRKKRLKMIDDFVKQVENGSKVVNIVDSKVYKIKLPLFFVNLHTSPVSFLHIALQGSYKAYVLPVPHSYIGEIKDLLNENS